MSIARPIINDFNTFNLAAKDTSVIGIATSFDDLPPYQMHNLLQSSFVADAITDTLKRSVQNTISSVFNLTSHKVGQKTSLLSSQSGEKAETAQ